MSAVARRYFMRGQRALDCNDADEAVEALASAIDLAPAFTDARLAYAVALARIGDTPRASQTLRSGIAHAHTDQARAALYFQLGEVLTQGGDFPGALDAFSQSSAHPAWSKRCSAGRARVLAKTGKHKEAVAEMCLAAGRGPSDAGD